MSVEECKRALPLPDLWRKLGLPGEPKRATHSPFRADKNPSFSVFQKEGKWFFKDHAVAEHHGDEVDLIRVARNCEAKEAIRLYHELAGVAPDRGGSASRPLRGSVARQAGSGGQKNREVESRSPPPKPARDASYKPDWEKLGQVACVYDYRNAAGEVVHQSFRFEPKNFRQRRRPIAGEMPASDGWVYFLDGIEPLLYRLPEVITASEAEPIFLVEGEKDADALVALGLEATTVPMGAGKWRDSYTEYLRGKWVVVLGDHDEAGRKHVDLVAAKLYEQCARVGAVELVEKWPTCPHKADLSDWLTFVGESPGEIGLGDSVSSDDLRVSLKAKLLDWAREARTPAALRFSKCFGVGERGGLLVYHDLLAEALVTDREVRFAGEAWWQWNVSRWKQLDVQREARRWVMEGIASVPQYRSVMTSNMVSSIEDLMMNRSAMHPDRFNAHDGNLINVANGMLDVRDLSLRPHESKYLSTVQLPHRFDATSTCPLFLEWLREMLPAEDVQAQVQEIFGYCLSSGLNYHKFFFFQGDGGTGKSTCTEVLTWLIGEENAVSVRLQDLDNPFNRAQLVGKRLYLAPELNRDSFKHIDLIKGITSGDPIHVEKKHKDGYTYRPQGKFIMTSNVRATTNDTTDGFFRRLCQVTFENKISEEKKDFRLLEKFKAEMDGILFWSLEGLRRLMERGRFEQTTDSKKAAEMLQMHRASAKAFFEQCVEEIDDRELMLSSEQLFTEYKLWCEWEHVKPYFESADYLTRELLNRFPHLRDRRKRVRVHVMGGDYERQMCYVGLRFQGWRQRQGVE